MRFLSRELEELLDVARCELADFVGADPEDLVLLPNATTGVNTVLRSLKFEPEDELLITNHGYNACRNALNFIASRTGAKIIVAEIPFPIASAAQVIEAVMVSVSPRTRLALLDHVTSQTGIIFPLAALVSQLTEQGIATLVDGAHAPGMLPLDLHTIGAAYYTGNCHKWLCAPKGAAFLYVQSALQSAIRPLTISHGANSPRTDRSRFQLEFGWTGTDDPTAYLCIPQAIQFMGSLLPGGWPEVMAHNHTMVLSARQKLCQALGTPLPSPNEMIGSLAAIPLPDGESSRLQDQLLEQFNIEVPVFPWPEAPQRLIRISANLYNQLADYKFLADALIELLAG